MTNRCGDTLDWTSYDLPRVLRKGTQSATFSYGVDRARYKQVLAGAMSETIYYVGSLFEKHDAGASTKYRHYVPFRGENVIMVDRLPDTTTTVEFLHRDHQGSVAEVTSESGTFVDSFAFDAWGLRRNPTTWAPLADPFGGTQITERGYTDHEHLDPVGLIHMNGRVQDPRLGRFISPDPYVQAPYSSQSHNRYSYVWSNPGTFIDPSGFQCSVDHSVDGGVNDFNASHLSTPHPMCGLDIAFAYGWAGNLAAWGDAHSVDTAIASVNQCDPCRDSPSPLPEVIPGSGGGSGRTDLGDLAAAFEAAMAREAADRQYELYLSALAHQGNEEAASELSSIRQEEMLQMLNFVPMGGVTKLFAARGILATPKVSSPKLQNIINDLYKGTTNPGRVGTGTTADAVRHELATGQAVGGRFHSQKAADYARRLENWLRGNPNAPYQDRLVAQSVLGDLRSALGGGP